MTRHPAAYLRRSYVDPGNPGDISREAQREAVRRLAHRDGHNGNLREYDDWGVSADVAKAGKRTAYAQLLADMDAGTVSAVYAFDVDRLYRDPRDLMRLQDAASRHGVRVVTTAGDLPIGEGGDPAGEAFAFIGAVFGRMELQKSKKRNRAAIEARRARGDVFGHAPYGYRHVKDAAGRIVREVDPSQPVQPILEAVREAGSILGAVKLLNARKIPSPTGKRWHTSALTRVVEAHAPELLPRKGASGRRQPVNALLGQLLRCHCGHVLTPNRVRGQYWCYEGHRQGREAHGKWNVTEAALVPWVQAEAARFRPSGKVRRGSTDARRSALLAEREDVGIAFTRRMISLEAAEARQAEIDTALASLEAAVEAVQLPEGIDWERWGAADINAVLRTYWHAVQLGDDMLPVRAEWRLPAEYVR